MKSPKTNTKIGLALGDGGPRGLAHIGVIKALEENRIPVDFISGSSAGALIGGLYAASKDIERVEHIFLDADWKDALRLFDPLFKTGLMRGDKLKAFIKSNLGKIDKIESCAIPFSAVATDLKSGEAIVLAKGSLVNAIRASISIPMVFKPCNFEGYILVDGGLSMPVPVSAVRNMGAKKIIAVNLHQSYSFNNSGSKNRIGAFRTGVDSFLLLSRHLSGYNSADANVIITPKLENLTFLNFNRFLNGKNIIADGYRAANEKIKELNKLLNTRNHSAKELLY